MGEHRQKSTMYLYPMVRNMWKADVILGDYQHDFKTTGMSWHFRYFVFPLSKAFAIHTARKFHSLVFEHLFILPHSFPPYNYTVLYRCTIQYCKCYHKVHRTCGTSVSTQSYPIIWHKLHKLHKVFFMFWCCCSTEFGWWFLCVVAAAADCRIKFVETHRGVCVHPSRGRGWKLRGGGQAKDFF